MIKHSGHLRTLEKCRKHSPAARVFYISLVFSNARRVLSQCNTWLRLLYLLNKELHTVYAHPLYLCDIFTLTLNSYYLWGVTKKKKTYHNLSKELMTFSIIVEKKTFLCGTVSEGTLEKPVLRAFSRQKVLMNCFRWWYLTRHVCKPVQRTSC